MKNVFTHALINNNFSDNDHSKFCFIWEISCVYIVLQHENSSLEAHVVWFTIKGFFFIFDGGLLLLLDLNDFKLRASSDKMHMKNAKRTNLQK